MVLVVVVVVSIVLSLEVSTVVEPRLLLGLHHLLVQTTVGIHLPTLMTSSVHAVQGLRSSLVSTLVELEGRFQQHGEKVDQILRATQAC